MNKRENNVKNGKLVHRGSYCAVWSKVSKVEMQVSDICIIVLPVSTAGLTCRFQALYPEEPIQPYR